MERHSNDIINKYLSTNTAENSPKLKKGGLGPIPVGARARPGSGAEEGEETPKELTGELEEEHPGRPTLFPPGTKVNFLEVVGPAEYRNRFGRPVSRRWIQCRCFAPKEDGSACGKLVKLQYQQLYYDSSAAYSCGCKVKPKHPPLHMEGQTHGCVEVLRWAEEEGWELACGTCGLVLYRHSKKEVEAAGLSCEGHKISSADEAQKRHMQGRRPRGRPPNRQANTQAPHSSQDALTRACSLPPVGAA